MAAWKKTFHANLATTALVVATFFNPLGFDVLFKMTMDLTGSYWVTTSIFYVVSAFFFGLFFLFKKLSK
jgi:hypothetical protein